MLAINQVAASLFRFIGGVARNMIVANVFAMLVMMAAIILNGFIIIRGNNSSYYKKKCKTPSFINLCSLVYFSIDKVKKWWIWGYWISPLMYVQNAITVNEMLGNSWHKVLNGTISNETLGVQVLKSHGVFPEAKWYWIGFGALLGFTILLNVVFTFALTYLKREDLASF
jgi:hypothetical protein